MNRMSFRKPRPEGAYLAALLVTLVVGCDDQASNQSSSSSHWVSCKHDIQCLDLQNSVGCSDGFCVDSEVERVRISEHSSSVAQTTHGSSNTCKPSSFEPTYELEYDALGDTDARLVVVRPADDWSYDDFRVFFGESGAELVERRVLSVARQRDGGTTDIEFLVDGEKAQAHFPVTPLGSEGDAGEPDPSLSYPPGTLTLGEDSLELTRLDAPKNRQIPDDPEFHCTHQTRAQTQSGGSEDGDALCGVAAEMFVCLDAVLEELEPAAGGEGRPLGATFSARVSRVGMGRSNDNPRCPNDSEFSFGTIFAENAEAVLEMRWLELSDDAGETSLISILVPGFDWDLVINEILAVRASTQPGSFGPGRHSLELRNQSDELLLWIADAGSIDDMTVPSELKVDSDSVQCERSDDCISAWEQRKIAVAINDAQATLAYGESRILGEYTVVNSALDVQTGNASCDDAFIANARIAVFKTPQRVCAPPAPGVGYTPAPFGCNANCVDGLRGFGTECGCACLEPTVVEQVCNNPVDPGDCTEETPRYYFDSASATCKAFTYSGCGGNWNNFNSPELCEEACAP